MLYGLLIATCSQRGDWSTLQSPGRMISFMVASKAAFILAWLATGICAAIVQTLLDMRGKIVYPGVGS